MRTWLRIFEEDALVMSMASMSVFQTGSSGSSPDGRIMGITIVDVKIIGVCSKHRKSDDDIIKDRFGNIVLDEDIECIECSFG